MSEADYLYILERRSRANDAFVRRIGIPPFTDKDAAVAEATRRSGANDPTYVAVIRYKPTLYACVFQTK